MRCWAVFLCLLDRPALHWGLQCELTSRSAAEGCQAGQPALHRHLLHCPDPEAGLSLLMSWLAAVCCQFAEQAVPAQRLLVPADETTALLCCLVSLPAAAAAALDWAQQRLPQALTLPTLLGQFHGAGCWPPASLAVQLQVTRGQVLQWQQAVGAA